MSKYSKILSYALFAVAVLYIWKNRAVVTSAI